MTAKPNANGTRRKRHKSSGNSKRVAKTARTSKVAAAGKNASARPKPKREKTADELMMEVWEYTYKTRDRRLTNP
jgi:hypothetical protein